MGPQKRWRERDALENTKSQVARLSSFFSRTLSWDNFGVYERESAAKEMRHCANKRTVSMSKPMSKSKSISMNQSIV